MSAPPPSPPDRSGRVRIDRSRLEDRWRYACPHGHSDWAPTRDHLWCTACARRRTRDGVDVDPRYERVLDKKRDELLAYEGVNVD